MSFTSYVMHNLTFILAIFIFVMILIAVLVARYEPDAEFWWIAPMIAGLSACVGLIFIKLPNRNELLDTLKRK